ncbi:hypothetical protein OROMI_023953 [Orobanche minor]
MIELVKEVSSFAVSLRMTDGCAVWITAKTMMMYGIYQNLGLLRTTLLNGNYQKHGLHIPTYAHRCRYAILFLIIAEQPKQQAVISQGRFRA